MILLAPVKTEKAIQRIEYDNALVFKVMINANKKEIKDEFESLFGAKVKSIHTFVTSKGEKHAIVKLTKDFKADDVSTKLKMIA